MDSVFSISCPPLPIKSFTARIHANAPFGVKWHEAPVQLPPRVCIESAPSATQSRKSEGPAIPRETLTITDNRTGKNYEVPIVNDAIRAADLRQIKVDASDFGMMSYDPAFNNTASCISKVTFIDGDAGILRYRGYPIEDLAEKSTY